MIVNPTDTFSLSVYSFQHLYQIPYFLHPLNDFSYPHLKFKANLNKNSIFEFVAARN